MITRFFHPVGQGAFYSERHNGYNIVYDCGVLHVSNASKEIVKQAFTGEVIDILFISHLDYDHISLIDTLKANNKIKYVILPLTRPSGQILSLASCITGNKPVPSSLVTLITDPRKYFGPETKVIEVKSGEMDSGLENNIVSVEDCRKELPSGTPITIRSSVSGLSSEINDNWCFIPYNNESYNREKLFKTNITNKKLDYDQLTNVEYFQDYRQVIKKCYEDMPDGTNGNSMVLYSGPIGDGGHKISHHFLLRYPFWHYYHLDPCKVGCLFTGDVNLHDVDLNLVFKLPYKGFVGTVQIPHHGSWLSFNENNFFKEPVIAPVSYGNNNFGHPSIKVMDILLRHGHTPVPITDEKSSIFVQVIR